MASPAPASSHRLLLPLALLLLPVATAFPDATPPAERSYELPEVVVRSKKHKYLHIVAYLREYSSLYNTTDTIFLFREKIVDFMLPTDKKVKGGGWTAPRLLGSRSYFHFTDGVLDSVSDYFPVHFSLSDWIGLPKGFRLPEALKDTDRACDTVSCGRRPALVWRKEEDRVNLGIDVLADESNSALVPGLSRVLREHMDCENMVVDYRFDNVYADTILASNFSGMTFHIGPCDRGRSMRTVFHRDAPASSDTYAELYVSSREYMTGAEAARCSKKPPRRDELSFEPPEEAPELHPYILGLMARVNAIDHAEIRMKEKPDARLGGIEDLTKKYTFVGWLKSLIGLGSGYKE